MRKLFTIFLILAWLPLAHASDAEFNRAYDADQSGDYKTAFAIWKTLAEEGDVLSQFNIALMYEDGEGVPQNYAEAFKWYKKAAEQGNRKAQNNLGLMYYKGNGIKQNYSMAVKWYRKASNQGNPIAQSNLGYMYYDGYGVPKNFTQAYMWISIAKANGDEQDEDVLYLMEKEMTVAEVAKAQALAGQCWESEYQNCGE